MGYKLSYQQKSVYKQCPKCGKLLIMHTQKEHFKIGHNMNYCYNCGFDLREGNDIIDLASSWGFYSVNINNEPMIYNIVDNIVYKNIPKEIESYFKPLNLSNEPLNFSEREIKNIKQVDWNFDYC